MFASSRRNGHAGNDWLPGAGDQKRLGASSAQLGLGLGLSKRYLKLALTVIVGLATYAFLRGLGQSDGGEETMPDLAGVVIVEPDLPPAPTSASTSAPEPELAPTPTPSGPLPPLFENYHQYELELPQHDPALPWPEGREGRYLYIENHGYASGWNNIMQEMMLNAFFSHVSGRTFVFYNYTWNPDNSLYSMYNGKYIPSRIPMTALLTGPIAGQPFLTDATAPRAVSEEFYDEVCPESDISRPDKELVERFVDRSASAATMTRQWMELLETQSRCVHLTPTTWQIFDIWIFGDAGRLLDIWPTYSKSPILTEFRWSPLIEIAFDTNREIISPTTVAEPYLSSIPANVLSAARYTEIPGLLAMHVRRGDYEDHCRNLADWGAGYTGFNSFPEFPDKLAVPAGLDQEGKREYYALRCWPTVAQIVQHAENIRSTPAGRGLRNVFIMSNGAAEWMEEVKAAFARAGGWAQVAGSRDMLLTHEQGYVKQAVDMVVGQRAQVFVGNGFSSMSGQINLLRMANGFAADSVRHW